VSRLAYKYLARGAVGPVSEAVWPAPRDGAKGGWIEATAPLSVCESGVHVCSADELAHWLHEELWLVEIDGPEVPGIDCIVASRARLVHEIKGWRSDGAARFAEAARDHAAQLVAAAPPTAQPRLLQYVSDASNHLPRGSTALAAFCSAMAVAWLHGRDHFDDGAYRQERAWQSAFIAADLRLITPL
jgi:hypothetical protein